MVVCIVWAGAARLERYDDGAAANGGDTSQAMPSMATLDAYYTLRFGRGRLDGSYVPHAPDPLRLVQRPQFPPDTPVWHQQRESLEWLPQRQPRHLPAISRLTAFVSQFCGKPPDCAGIVLPVMLSSLFMLPLFLYSWHLGYPAAGILAGLVTTFSGAYYLRSGAGWLDTDILNLFFPWTIAWSFLLLHRGLTLRQLVLRTLTAGLVLNLYMHWYPKPFVALAYLGTLALYLAVQRVGLRNLVLGVSTFAIAMNPMHLVAALPHLRRFLARRGIAPETAGIDFPNVMQSVAELQPLSLRDALSTILANGDAAAAGLLAFAVFAVLRWRQIIPLLPLLLLGIGTLLGTQRFGMYLAPFAGLGLGVLLCVIVYAGGEKLLGRRDLPAVQVAAFATVLVTFLFWLAPKTAITQPYRPALAPEVQAAIERLAEAVPADARIWTWWDTGFAIAYLSGRAVYHDGGAQDTPQTNLIARSFAATDPNVLRGLVRFVDAEGNAGIARLGRDAKSLDGLIDAAVAFDASPGAAPVYVLYTADMIGKWPAMRTIAGLQPGASRYMSRQIALDCSARDGNVMRCADGDINLGTGRVGDRLALTKTVFIEDGELLQSIDYPGSPDGWYLQVLLRDRQPYAVYLLDEAAFRSNLNQMYMLGRFDARLFDQILNDFPAARLFRVL